MENKDKVYLAPVECYRQPMTQNTSLLRILNNGLPVHEPSFLWMHKDCCNADQDKDPSIYAEKKLRMLVQPVQSLRYHLEKYLLIMDYKIRMQQSQQDEQFHKKNVFLECQKSKDDALKHLYQIRQLITFTGLDTTTSKRTLALLPSVRATTRQDQWIAFVIMLAHRASLYKQLVKNVDQQIQLNRSAIADQMTFLRTIIELEPYWPFQKIPYAQHVFERGSDYPYRAEIRVDLLNVPWSCWGLNRPCAKVDTVRATDTVESEELYESVPPPFLCWPPLPFSPPFSPASAEIFFVALDPKLNVDHHKLGIQIRWIGDASYCIESKRELKVKIIPIFSTDIDEIQNEISKESNVSQSNATFKVSDILNYRTQSRQFYHQLVSWTPSLVEIPEGWLAESKELHERLQKAQWSLIDRAIHLVYQTQAARLKRHLDTVCYGTANEAERSRHVLRIDEEFESHLSLYQYRLFKTLTKQNLHQSQTNEFSFQTSTCYRRRITVDDWEPYMTSITLRSCPIYSMSCMQHDVVESVHSNYLPAFSVNLCICVSYEAGDSFDDLSQGSHHQNAWDFLLNTETPSRMLKARFLHQLPLAEAIATCFLRHLFLSAWKHNTSQLPKETFDLHYSTLPFTRAHPGIHIFSQFIDWLETYLAFHVVSNN